MNLNVLSNKYRVSPQVESSNSTSFLVEALSFISDNRTNRIQIQEAFYRDLLEAGDNRALLMEASTGLIDGIKNIIDKFIAFIKKIFTKFITTLKGIVKSDKYLVKNKDKLMSFGYENEFEMSIYKFTHIDDDSFPNIHAYNVYKTNDFSKATKAFDSDVIAYTAQIYHDFRDDMNDWYDKFRGVVLTDTNGDFIASGVNSYTSSEFSSELREKFRNGESSPTKTTITNVEVRDAFDRFENYEKTLSHIEKMKRELEREYKSIKDDIKNLPAAWADATADAGKWHDKLAGDFIGAKNKNVDIDAANRDKEYNNLNDKEKKQVDANISSFIKAKADQIDEMCRIHTMAFSAKLDACKACYKQDKELLYAALKKVNKTYDYRKRK